MQNFLNELIRLQIKVSLNDQGGLSLTGPKDALTPALRASLVEHKEALLKMLKAGVPEPDDARPITPQPQARFEPFPLNDVQHAYWSGRQMAGVSTHFYTEHDSDDVDLMRLQTSLNQLIARHDMLRAVVQANGQQRVLPTLPPYTIDTLDLRDMPANEQAHALQQWRERLSHQVLSTDQAPLMSLRAARLTHTRTRLFLSWDLLVVDASSIGLLFDEWQKFYNDPAWSPAPLQLSFRDYVLAESARQTGESYKRAERYWLARLDTLPSAPDLPLALAPESLSQLRFARQRGSLPKAVWSTLKQKAQAMGCTASVLLMTAFAQVLARWAQSPDFTLNLTLFSRQALHPEVAGLVGDFTSLSLLQCHHGEPLPFAQRATQLQRQLATDLDHAQYSGVRVLRERASRLGTGPRTAAMPVVFTSALTLTGANADTMGEGFLGPSVYGVSQTPQVWLDHQVFEQQGSLAFNWDSVQGLFPQGLLEDMLASYLDLLNRLAQDTAPSESQAPYVNLPAWQEKMRLQANATAQKLPVGLLHAPFAEQVRRRPQAIALATSTEQVTYAQLGARACQLARRLQQLGVQRNTLVAVMLEKSPAQIAAVLGVLYAGAAYLPIDPNVPPARRRQLLEQAQTAAWVVVASPTDGSCWPAGVREVALDDPLTLSMDDTTPMPLLSQAQDLAYVIFTSGSTGQPKGVMIEHRTASNTVLDINQRFGVGSDDRVLALSALNFDLSVYDIFGVLGAGGTVVLPDPQRLTDPIHWTELIRQHQVTLWNTVPALMQIWSDYLRADATHPGDSLRLGLLSGDWIPLKLPDQIRTLLPGLQLVSLGGATEVSIWSVAYTIDEVLPHWKSIPYGKPLANQTLHVYNNQFDACPVWCVGDIYIGGQGLAQGYLHDAAKTQERFIVHPTTGERLYKTGDLGRYLPDGNIEFLGRSDFQVKINGYRVELGEIAAPLRALPGIKEVVVTTTSAQGSLAKQLVAYVVLQPNYSEPPNISTWREALAQWLPDYMVPHHYIVLPNLPLSANGKVDLSQLPALDLEAASHKTHTVAPSTETERHLMRLWAAILAYSDFGVTDRFFDLGGNSMDLVSVATQIQVAYELQGLAQRTVLASFFEQPTIAHLAAKVDELVAASGREHHTIV